ncbi:glycosyltransferase [Chryseobacterium lathyri]|uniref:Glycosyltransferase involved in cell wall biosynthesis n=1 Tax=Chryseobacterium lathyri TaxID=395933 RepID=A0ABT9SG59_9FLAO|nr:glycosyltransferase [Chryseobacterium lathyri]MDP9958412.1 glycosyltransferase involved in cell wall biosynthesis [Chryseobacterium lathyri]MDQ0066445.1 glycosyltransferase involved in cell wall biosynthesis [Chryseobacterium lathyri]
MTASVALCTYNGEKYIAEQLESILSQIRPVSEIIVCDDNSTDETFKILSDYAARYPDIIRIHRNTENTGYVQNFEKAMSLCTGDLVFLCDQDDRWNKDKTAIVTQIFEKHPHIDIISHNIKLFGEEINSAEEITYWDLDSINPDHFTQPQDIVKRILFKGNIFPGMSTAIRSTFLKENLPLKKINSTIIHDYELLLIASSKDSVWMEKRILGEYRIHPKQSIGYKTFAHFNTPEKEILSRDSLFAIFKRFPFVKDAIQKLNLNVELEKDYKTYCIQQYKNYIKSIPLLKSWITRLKMKYYFHIFDYLK